MKTKLLGTVLFLCGWVAVPAMLFAGEAKQLFNGKDMDGWEHVGPGRFTVEDGILKTHGGMGLLWYTREKVGNAVLRIVYKASKAEDNSGVFIRISGRPSDPWYAVHHGYEVQILGQAPEGMPNDPWHTTGAIYSISQATAQPSKPFGEWNTLEIRLDGPRTLVTLNGVMVNDYKEGDPVPPRKQQYEPERGPRPDSGYVGLQNHHEDAVVVFKEISIHPLKK